MMAEFGTDEFSSKRSGARYPKRGHEADSEDQALSGPETAALTSGLIQTKLKVPYLYQRDILRSHLMDRFSQEKGRALIALHAVAGSGKTCLATQFIRHEGIRAAWYSIDEADNDPNIFFRYVLASLSLQEKIIAEAATPLLLGEEKLIPSHVVAFLIERLSLVSENIYLFLDDYHLITETEIHDALLYFLYHMPTSMHVVIMSRHEIPFSLACFRVRNQLLEILTPDLRFTENEVEQFFRETIPLSVTSDTVHALTVYTEGWASGLQLIGLALSNSGDSSDDFAKVNQEVTEYFVDEVVGKQPEDVQALLYRTGLLKRFNAGLCKELLQQDATGLLDYIKRNNLFLVSLDSDGVWYRYHSLFSKAIKSSIDAYRTDLRIEIYRKAALWFAKNGHLEDALECAFATEDCEFVADLMEENLLQMYENNAYAAVLKWLERLPFETLNKRPLLRLHQCGQMTESFRVREIDMILKEMEGSESRLFEQYDADKQALCWDLYNFCKYIAYFYCAKPMNANVKQLVKAYANISPENKIFRSYIKIAISLSYLLRGNPTSAIGTLNDVSATVFNSTSLFVRMDWFKVLADAERMQGRLHRTESITRKAFGILDERGLSNTPLQHMLKLPIAWVYYYRDDLDKALEGAITGVKYAEETRFVRDITTGNYLLFLIHMARNEREQAHQCIENLQTFVDHIDVPPPSVSPYLWLVRFWLMEGDLDRVGRWMDESAFSVSEPFSLYYIYSSMIRAEYLCRRERHEEACQMLEKVAERCAHHKMMIAALNADLLHAASLYHLKDYRRARQLMEQAMPFFEDEGLVRPFRNKAVFILPLLADMVVDTTCSCRTGLRSMLAILNEHVVSKPLAKGFDQKRGGYNLTKREIQILRLMCEGLEYKEIAATIFVSYETVRTHTKNIFEKLGVNSRLGAIRKADFVDLDSAIQNN